MVYSWTRTFTSWTRGQSLAALCSCHLWLCLHLSIQCGDTTYGNESEFLKILGPMIFRIRNQFQSHILMIVVKLFYKWPLAYCSFYILLFASCQFLVTYSDRVWIEANNRKVSRSHFHAKPPISCGCNYSSLYGWYHFF